MSPDPRALSTVGTFAFVHHPPLWGTLRLGLMNRVVELMSTTPMQREIPQSPRNSSLARCQSYNRQCLPPPKGPHPGALTAHISSLGCQLHVRIATASLRLGTYV